MLPFDPLSVSTLLILASGAGAACGDLPRTAINVTPSASETKLVTARDLEQLQDIETDTVDPYGIHANTLTQGLMKGLVSIQPQITMDYKQLPGRNEVCIWYESIDIKIHIDPEIHIAQEVYNDRCMRNAVVEHENKHVTVDRRIVNQYARRIGQVINGTLTKEGFSDGPMSFAQAERRVKEMQILVVDLVRELHDEMQATRRVEQQKIDTLEEYEYVSKKCPRFNTGRNGRRK